MMRLFAFTLLVSCATQLPQYDDAGNSTGNDLSTSGNDLSSRDFASHADMGRCLNAQPTPGSVACGTNMCSVPNGDSCCLSVGSAMCVTGPCGPMSIAITCDGPEDCFPGQQCCVSNNPTQAACGNGCMTRLCHSASDCNPGEMCRRSNVAPNGNVGTCSKGC
jgi:hypothetical protein